MTDEKNIIKVEEAVEKKLDGISLEQSANTLFRFVEKPEYLYSVIENLAITPRYCVENTEYLQIGIGKIAYPMICFCDINMHKLHHHVEFYGGYGLGLSKKWGESNGIQPVQYINEQSILRKDFTSAFMDTLLHEDESMAANFLLSQMYYFKSLTGTMVRNGEEKQRIFTDECEWRYIPNLNEIGLPNAITEERLYSRELFNKTLEEKKECWLHFTPMDVKYIILQNQEEFNKVLEIINLKNISGKEKAWLISKVVIWSESKEDF